MFTDSRRRGGFRPVLAGLLAAVTWLGILDGAAFGASVEQAQARKILDAAGVPGGLVVHVGCGPSTSSGQAGRLTAALRAGDGYLVQGLDADAGNVEKARAHIRSLGKYGPVSADTFDGRHLPYAANLVNLVVSEDLGEVPMAEVMRVLCPNGVAYVKRPQPGKAEPQWTKTVKPRPKGIDEWTHYLHDSTNNAVAHDTVIAPLRHLQWIGSPRYSRHHDHMSAASAAVTAGGRVFYIFDHASPMSIQLPSQWRLVARDAFNGTVLWERQIAKWYTQMLRLKSGPAQLPRRLVADGDRVYVTLGLEAPVTALDAATGQTVRTFAGTDKTEEIIFSDGTLFLMVNDRPFRQPAQPNQLNYNYVEGPRRVVAVDADTGRVLWNQSRRGVLPLTLTADATHVLFHNGQSVVCLDRKTGREKWKSKPVERRTRFPVSFGPTLVAYRDVVLSAGGTKSMTALSAATGKTLWSAEHLKGGHHSSPEDLFVIDGVAWSGAIAGSKDSGLFVGRDVHTGKIRKRFLPDVKTHWFHHRCHRAKATVKYLLTSRTGIEFIDPKTGHWECHHWVRGACLYGILPANGMIYNPPHPCACYLEAKFYGFNALAPASPARKVPRTVSAAGRLEKGSAYGAIDSRKPDPGTDWPTHRGDAARSGYTKASVPAVLKQAWQADVGGRLSGVVVAGGRLFVASIDTHTVHALDAGSGKPVWSYTAGGRVDSPPTIWQGRVLFGSADGYVYCLRSSDGELMWRFRAAPVDWRIGAFEQIESIWPVHGSVLIREGELWCVAGRSMFVDGGLRLLRLDPATGRLIAEKIMDDRDPASGRNLQVRLKTLNMPVALPDVLSYDGKYVYMRSQRFDRNGVRQGIEVPTLDVTAQRGEGPHLFCPTGFLDDIWWHRSYWVFGRVWKSGAGGYYQAGRVAPAGRPMVVSDTKVYGYGRKPQYYRWTTPMEYQLFATDKQPRRVEMGGQAARRTPAPKAPAKPKRKRGTAKKLPAGRIALDWTQDVPVSVRAMVLADGTLFIAGPPDVVDEEQSLKAFGQATAQKRLARQAAAMEGAEGALLWAVRAADGKKLAERKLQSVPVFDGMIAANGRLYMATIDGKVLCLSGQ